ncbi:MAG: hypothetical protein ABIR57_10195 [Aeromicrobium sp.]
MTTVHIEHAVKDFAAWKAVFDRYPDMRAGHHVRRYDISRPVDDPKFVMIRLDFDARAEAEAFVSTMRGLWTSAQAASVLAGPPQARITETVEEASYDVGPARFDTSATQR